MKKLVSLFIMLFISQMCLASNFENLAKDGYTVIARTSIYNYDFSGCEYDKVYLFQNGLKFRCTEYNYHYSYNPDVYILSNRWGSFKVIIDDELFEGNLFR